MKLNLIKASIIIVCLYVVVCVLLYFFQEKIIFHPTKLDKDYNFSFDQDPEEINVTTEDQKTLNGILFKADNSKGLIFYLHGNGGCVASWGYAAATYTNLGYDVFMLDYRGYGKSEGFIQSEDQFHNDTQAVYDVLKKRYAENKIVVLGYSLGTGLSARLAAANNPRLLILQAPYVSLIDMMHHTFPIIPSFILKYKFETNVYLKSCKMPVVIFHGTQDDVIYYGSSVKLKDGFKKHDVLITLNGQGHNQMQDNAEYKSELEKILRRFE